MTRSTEAGGLDGFLGRLRPEQPEIAADEISDPYVCGAQVPIGLVVDRREGLPLEDVGESVSGSMLWVVPTHGGCGSTTLTRVLGAEAAGSPAPSMTWTSRRVTESPHGWAVGGWWEATTLLVARTHAAGMTAATAAARQWASGQLPVKLLGIVLIHDGPRLTRTQCSEVDRVAALVPRCWQWPWHEPWRDLPAPTLDDTPRPMRRVATSVVKCAGETYAGLPSRKGKR